MQENTLTLSVDAANNATPSNEVYERFLEEPNKSTYVGALHTEDDRDMLQLYRTAPKRSGESRGMKRSSVKATVDVSVPNASGSGNIVLPLIAELSVSVPVGTTDAEVIHVLQRIIAFADDTSGESLFTKTNI